MNGKWRPSNPRPTNSLQGRWEGTWLSDANQHTGALRCVVTQKSDGSWRARFHATYNKALSFGYTVTLKVEPSTNAFKFSGDANLGWYAGGVYHYEGHADDTNFFSTYSCKYDHGTFQDEKRPRKSSKHQAPTSREAPNSKHQTSAGDDPLRFGAWSFSGAWSLEFGA